MAVFQIAMFADVMLAGFYGVMRCVVLMPVSDVRMMTGGFMISRFMVRRSGAMVFGRMLVMFCCFAMVFRGFSGDEISSLEIGVWTPKQCYFPLITAR